MVIMRAKGIDTPFWCHSLLCRCGKDEPTCIKSSTYTCLEDWAKKQTAQENHLPPPGQQECTCAAHRSTRSSQRFPEPTPNKLGQPASMTKARTERLGYSEEKESHISMAYCQARPTPKLLGSAAVLHWHDYTPPSAGATLGISTGHCITQGRATRWGHSLNSQRTGKARETFAWGYTAGQPQSQVLRPAVHLTTLSVCQQRAQYTV